MNTPTTTQTVLTKVFANNCYKNMDTASLIKQLDISAQLRQGNQPAAAAVNPTVQSGTSISSIPANGILINAPGTYTFTGNISWSPTSPCSAITIEAQGVTLNLNNFTLTVTPTNPQAGDQYNGIYVLNSSNTIIQNGGINGATYYGISAKKSNTIAISGMTISNIQYSEFNTPYLTPCGIFFDTISTFDILNCTVTGISVTAPSCAGIQLLAAFGGTIRNCDMNNFLNNDGGVQGFSYLLCADVTTTGCNCTTFQSHFGGKTVTSGHTVIGYVPILCVDLQFDSCSSNGMTGCCDDCHGMSVFVDAFVTVTNFSAKNIIDGVSKSNTGAKATGLEVYGSNITISNCSSDSITAIVPQDLQSAGFSAWGDTISFSGCTASNVVVTDANKQPSIANGYGTGFGWAPDPRQGFNSQAANKVTYNNCQANNCQLGFDTWFHTNSVWENVTAPGCPIFILQQSDTTTRKLSMDKCSESPSGKPEHVILTNIAANNTVPNN